MAVTSNDVDTVEAAEVRAQAQRWVPRGIAVTTDIVVDHAHGAEVWDVDGKRYIDFAGGIGTLNVGHTPSEVVDAIRDQAGKLTHMCFQVAMYKPYIDLARRLAEMTPGQWDKKTMLVNSGAEAVENAIKIARAYTGRENVISFRNAFHGRTLMAMTLTGKDQPYKVGFGPYAPGVFHAPYPYEYRCPHPHSENTEELCPTASGEELEQLLATVIPTAEVAALIVEPVQGEGGFVVAPPEFLRRLRDICTREGIVFIVDEVQTGLGRTGRMLAVEHAGIEPDVVLLAKSLGGGLPLAAVVGKAEIMDAPGAGAIGTTFGGNPIACRSALAVLDLFETHDLLDRARQIGSVIFGRFRDMQSRYALIGDVRGLGAMVAMELVQDRQTKEPARAETAEVLHRCHAAGLIAIKCGLYDNVVRVLVPLAVTDAQLEEGLAILEEAVAGVDSARQTI